MDKAPSGSETNLDAVQIEERLRIETLQSRFSLIKVKVLLVSLLNGFRDLTLMGVQAFDFNHLNNVLVSSDCRHARLIDIDGASKGSIQFPSNYIQGSGGSSGGESGGGGGSAEEDLHKPALDVDLATMLPFVVQHLMFGKGRGKAFVSEQVSNVWRARTDDEAKVGSGGGLDPGPRRAALSPTHSTNMWQSRRPF